MSNDKKMSIFLEMPAKIRDVTIYPTIFPRTYFFTIVLSGG